MSQEDILKNVAVIGAAGKMGSGIALLILQEMARLEAEKTGAVGSGLYRLNLIDSYESGLISLRKYLRNQMTKYAEKQINNLRGYFIKNMRLVSNEEIVQAFVEGSMDIVLSDTQVDNAKNSTLIFEAIVEDINIKKDLFSQLKAICKPETLYLSNTSSIPITLLNQLSGLGNRLIGFHFYNPAAVQKLVEIVYPEKHTEQQEQMIKWLTKLLGKTAVAARDVAGFIGNGHFIREVIFACQKVKELTKSYTLPQAIFIVNKVTQDFLLRPMGIFQLIDYVGADVCQKIAHIMNEHLHDPSIRAELIDKMVKEKAIGGHHPDGTQKNGFFHYEKNHLTGIYNVESHTYIPIDESMKKDAEKVLGTLPSEYPTWKGLANSKEHEERIQKAFADLFEQQTLGAQLAHEFLQNSNQIASHLVQNGVAKTIDDVKTVLNLGFFHLYGPEIKVAEKAK